MPLIIVSGLPSSGKSTRVASLVKQLEKKITSLAVGQAGSHFKVIVHSDDSLGIPREHYRESLTEKALRGIQSSAVKRDLSRNNVVILDSLCYIKGFRYQLHCEAKQLVTPCCVMHVMAPLETCIEWNADRQGDKWDEELLRQLAMRYEEPDGNSRWDSPLIPVAYDEEGTPFELIWNALTSAKVASASAATLLKPATKGNYLQELDRITQSVISAIVADGGVSARVKVADELFLEVPPGVSNAKLQRIRRSFVTLNRVRSLDVDRIAILFVEYLKGNMERE